MRGAETLNSAVVRQLSANPGGSADGGQVYADIDHYAGGQAITMRVVGSDAQQNAVNQTSTLTMPAVD
jgi:hypothetical protein